MSIEQQLEQGFKTLADAIVKAAEIQAAAVGKPYFLQLDDTVQEPAECTPAQQELNQLQKEQTGDVNSPEFVGPPPPKKATPTLKSVPKQDTPKQPEPEPELPELPEFSDVTSAFQNHALTNGRDSCIELLKAFGVPKLNALPEGKWAEFIEACNG